jgi:hypothetical protein
VEAARRTELLGQQVNPVPCTVAVLLQIACRLEGLVADTAVKLLARGPTSLATSNL